MESQGQDSNRIDGYLNDCITHFPADVPSSGWSYLESSLVHGWCAAVMCVSVSFVTLLNYFPNSNTGLWILQDSLHTLIMYYKKKKCHPYTFFLCRDDSQPLLPSLLATVSSLFSVMDRSPLFSWKDSLTCSLVGVSPNLPNVALDH